MNRKLIQSLSATLVAVLFAFGGQAAEFHVTQASNGVSMVFDKRVKSKKVDPILLNWLAEGSFAPGAQRAIECSATVFDGKTSEGFGKRRRGVRVTLAGEIHDGAGNSLGILPTKKAITDKNGQVFLEFPIGDFDDFYVAMGGSFAKKKLTSLRLSCAAVAVAEAGGPTVSARSAGLPNVGPESVETVQWAVTAKTADRPTKLKKWESLELDFDATLPPDSVLECLFRISENEVEKSFPNQRLGKPKVRGSWKIRQPQGGEIVVRGEYSDLFGIGILLRIPVLDPNNQDYSIAVDANLSGSGKTSDASGRCSVKAE